MSLFNRCKICNQETTQIVCTDVKSCMECIKKNNEQFVEYLNSILNKDDKKYYFSLKNNNINLIFTSGKIIFFGCRIFQNLLLNNPNLLKNEIIELAKAWYLRKTSNDQCHEILNQITLDEEIVESDIQYRCKLCGKYNKMMVCTEEENCQKNINKIIKNFTDKLNNYFNEHDITFISIRDCILINIDQKILPFGSKNFQKLIVYDKSFTTKDQIVRLSFNWYTREIFNSMQSISMFTGIYYFLKKYTESMHIPFDIFQ